MTKEELKQKTISAISLGCDKNRVDLEHMLFGLGDFGFHITPDLQEANIIIVNTCAFLQSAIEEAIQNIELALSMKQNGVCEKVIVSGCLPMREKEEITQAYPQVDAFITLSDNAKIVEIIEKLYDASPSNFKFSETGRIITHEGGYAYLKIAEGCSNGCAYCTIPRIRGRFRSVPEKQILQEASALAKQGYHELILVAQDTARYGEDLYGTPRLVDLLEKLVKIKEIRWIKLQYIYPEWVSVELLEFIKNNPKMCKYLDMPLQHIDDEILKKMNRKTNEDETWKLLQLIKTNFPEIVLRSTFIVGFPTEKKKHFNKLCNFIASGMIPYASFFAYSREPKTPAFYMKGQVSTFTKNRRLKKIAKIQNVVMNKFLAMQVGTCAEVMIDGFDCQNQLFFGHTKNASPEIDLKITFDFERYPNLAVGEIVNAKFVEINEFGLKGEIV